MKTTIFDENNPFLLHIEPLRKHTSVKVLRIEDCSYLEAAPTESWSFQNKAFLNSSSWIILQSCCLLASFQNKAFLNSSSWIILQSCCLLASKLSSLMHVRLTRAYELQSLPQLPSLSSLMHVRLTRAYELQSLPQLPSSLRMLWISNCNEMLKERCQENNGADWFLM
ncbi:uncharacterized protein A4U43_C06F6120 [Asparagus officinalis]|uniref:Uncharacterized protein n=1 Tax=Asparagus officinalis TaxID=4686 RepID=A0A5P1EJX1_ASPOF|nr:uncharacterized protein A4U43_C06F6120 [Asparagus officinalis]